MLNLKYPAYINSVIRRVNPASWLARVVRCEVILKIKLEGDTY